MNKKTKTRRRRFLIVLKFGSLLLLLLFVVNGFPQKVILNINQSLAGPSFDSLQVKQQISNLTEGEVVAYEFNSDRDAILYITKTNPTWDEEFGGYKHTWNLFEWDFTSKTSNKLLSAPDLDGVNLFPMQDNTFFLVADYVYKIKNGEITARLTPVSLSSIIGESVPRETQENIAKYQDYCTQVISGSGRGEVVDIGRNFIFVLDTANNKSDSEIFSTQYVSLHYSDNYENSDGLAIFANCFKQFEKSPHINEQLRFVNSNYVREGENYISRIYDRQNRWDLSIKRACLNSECPAYTLVTLPEHRFTLDKDRIFIPQSGHLNFNNGSYVFLHEGQLWMIGD